MVGQLLKYVLAILLLFVATAHATRRSRCAEVLIAAAQERLGSVKEGRSSMLNADYSLIPEDFSSIVYEQMRNDEGALERDTGFFSQFRIDENGHLLTIVDPTFKKDSGESVADRWNKIPEVTNGFERTYNRALELAALLQQALPSENPMLAEVVFTHQIRKPSEGWHLDWYPAEYIIATQTFIAKQIQSESGDLSDAPNGGTEYLLSDGEGLPTKISFRVNKKIPVNITSTGYLFTTPTGLLAMHSGTNRVARALGDNLEYDIASPPHRGSQIPLEYRASIAVRFVRSH